LALSHPGGANILRGKVDGYGTSSVQLPYLELKGLCDGSVIPSYRFKEAAFFANLQPNEDESAWSGFFNLTDPNGNTLAGLLIGLLRSPSDNETFGEQFQGLLIAPDGLGRFHEVAGFGTLTLDLGEDFTDPFTGKISIAPEGK